MSKEETKRIGINLPLKVYDMLVKEAEYEDRKVANMAVRIIKQHYNLTDDDE